jgi:quercetin dioxygenase-like cupin family protein
MWAVALEHAMLSYFEVEPGCSFPPHEHEAEQITLVLEGELVFHIDGRQPIVVKAGDVIAIPAWVPHATSSGATPTRAVDAWSPPPESSSWRGPPKR